MKIKFTFNSTPVEWDVPAGEVLIETLRRLGWYGTKRGCNTGDCGTCTVNIDGEAVNACQVFTATLEGQSLRTIEGLAGRDVATGQAALHPVQEHFVRAAAVQCGFCIPGMVMSSVALLEKNPTPSDEEIHRALDGNLCRCTGYVKIFDAVRGAAAEMAAAPKEVAR
jgi:aerobic carbon-monoxide dehydrogenase small subunit